MKSPISKMLGLLWLRTVSLVLGCILISTVLGAQNFTLSPTTLTFYAQAGSPTAPDPQTVTINSSGIYTFSATTSSSGGWLSITGPTANVITVNVNPAGLAPNTYYGSINVYANGGAAGTQLAVVTLVVGTQQTVTGAPATLAFSYQSSGSLPPPQLVTLSSSSPVNYTAAASAVSASWLGITPANGALPGNPTLTITVSPYLLPPGTYNGEIIITQTGTSNVLLRIPVTLTVGGMPNTLAVVPGALAFAFQMGGSVPGAQQLTITGNAPNFVISSNAAWLSATTASPTLPGTASISVNPTGLGVGTHSGAVVITSSFGETATVPVTLVVGGAPVLSIGPSTLAFSYVIGGAVPPAQTLAVASSAGGTFTATANATWVALSQTSGNVPATISVSVNPGGLTAATYQTTITVTSPGVSNSPQQATVTLVVSGTGGAFYVVSSPSLTFNYQIGGTAPASQLLTVSSGMFSTFTASPSSTNGFVSVSPTSSLAVPATLTVSVNVANLLAATYTGSVVLTTPNGTQQLIPVTLVVTGTTQPTLSADRTTLSFSYQQGGSVPAAQTVQISASPGSPTVTGAANATWVNINPSSGATPFSASIGVNPAGLGPGTYNATVTFSASGAANSPQISVTLTVTPAPTISADSVAVSFTARSGETPPDAQRVTLTSTGGAVAFTVTITGAAWLSASPTGSTTPADLVISANISNLNPGNYSGTISVAGTGANTLTIRVDLTVTGPLPTVTRITNAASDQPGPIAPGEILILRGRFIGPAEEVGTLIVDGIVASRLAETRVLFSGNPGPVQSASSNRVVATVPYGIASRQEVVVQVEYRGVRSNGVTLQVVRSTPGLFTQDKSGTGQADAQNQDGSLNTPDNPAEPESVVVFFGSGDGVQNMDLVDGMIVQDPPYASPVLPVSVELGGIAVPPENIRYVGVVPGQAPGMFKIEVKLTPGLQGQVPVKVVIGAASSQDDVFFSVK